MNDSSILSIHKILVIGSPGSGKSTLSRKLSEILHIPCVHLDLLYHQADRTTVSREEFDQKLQQILAKKSWIIDGNYRRTLSVRLEQAQCVIWLDLPADVCLDSARSRIGTKRPDLPWIEEAFDPEFEQYITTFPQTRRPEMIKMLQQARENGKAVLIFRSRNEVQEWLCSLAEMKKKS